MRRRVSILSLLACPLLSLPVAAQTREAAVPDSDRVIVIDPGLSLGTPVLILPRTLDERRAFIVPSFDSPPWQAGMPLVTGPLVQRIDLLAPLHLQWEREKRMEPYLQILGVMEAGAVGYAAYEHIRKYGLFR